MKGTLKITEERIKIAAITKALHNYSHSPSGSPPPAVPATVVKPTLSPAAAGAASVVAGDAKAAPAPASPALPEVWSGTVVVLLPMTA